MIQIIFEFASPLGTFRDSLILPDDHGLSEDQLTSMKQDRFDNWMILINPPTTAPQE